MVCVRFYISTDLKFLNCTNKNEKKTNNCFHVLFYILYVTRHLALTIAVNAKTVTMSSPSEKTKTFVNLKNPYLMICKLILI